MQENQNHLQDLTLKDSPNDGAVDAARVWCSGSELPNENVGERIEAVLAKVRAGAQAVNAAYAGNWTPDEFTELLRQLPELSRLVQMAEAQFLAQIEIDIASQTSNAAMMKHLLSSRGQSPLSDRKGHMVAEKNNEDEEYDMMDDDLNLNYNPQVPEEMGDE